MIRTALEFIKKELETYIVERENDSASYTTGNVVDLNAIVSPKGDISLDGNKHIAVTLVGLEEERREGKRPYLQPADGNNFLRLNPPVELDLFVLFTAHHSNYETALRDLSDVIAFFQANPVFDEQKFPSLNAPVSEPDIKPWQLIERLSFRLHNLSFEQQNNLWAVLGSKFIPSVLYKMNLLTVFETRSKEKAAAVTNFGILEN